MQTDLLWVYEGLTSYLGDMLTARSGERTPELAREALAEIAADLDHRSAASGAICRILPTASHHADRSQGLGGLPPPGRLLRRRRAQLAGGGCDHPTANQN